MNWLLVTKLKIFKDRLMAWGTVANFIMLACLSVGIRLESWHLAALAFVCLAVAAIDMKYILPREQEYYFKRNPEWQKLSK